MLIKTLPGASIAIVTKQEQAEGGNELIFCSLIPQSGEIEIPDEFFTSNNLIRIRKVGWLPFEMQTEQFKHIYERRHYVVELEEDRAIRPIFF